MRETPADARAGEWPYEAVKQLKAVVRGCVDYDPEERPADMATVVRELRALLERHCPASAGEASDAMMAELAAARAQLDLMRLDQQFQDMQRARAAAPQLQCCVCMDDVAASDGCACSGAAPGHFFCNDCFSDMVASQVTGEGKPLFLAAGCEVTCSVCQVDGVRSVFDMRLCAPHLTPAAYSAYLKTMAEPEVVREQREWQQRMQQQQADYTARLRHVEDIAAAAALVEPHTQHIAEQLILPRCPTQSCRRFIPDFEACAGLQVRLIAPGCLPTHAHATAISAHQPCCCSAAASLDEATCQGWAAAPTSAVGACTCAAMQATATITFAPAVSTPTPAAVSRRSRTRRRGEQR